MPYKFLDLPEGRIHVARYLDLIDLKCCTLVSKPWHHDFQPFVWRIWAARARESHTAAHIQDIDSLNTIRKNASYIRHLSLLTWVGPMDPDLNQILRNHCRRLDTLEAIGNNENEQYNVSKIVKANPQLRSLHVQRRQGSSEVQNGHYWLAITLKGHSHLYELHLDYSLMEAAALQILEACPSLKRLTVVYLSNNDTTTKLTCDKPTLGLAYFKVKAYCHAEALSTLLNRCPSLETLSLRMIHRFHTNKPALFDRLEHLTALDLDYADTDICCGILSRIPLQQLRSLSCRTLSSKELSLLVEHQFQSLEALKVVIKDFAPEDMACLFTKFYRLRRLILRTPGEFDVRHIITTPWAICSTIEVLHFPFGILRVCQDETLKQYAAVEKEQEGNSLEEWQQAQRVFMKRLGECTRLRSIRSLQAHRRRAR